MLALDIVNIVVDFSDLLLFGTDAVLDIRDHIFQSAANFIGELFWPKVVDRVAAPLNIAFVMIDWS